MKQITIDRIRKSHRTKAFRIKVSKRMKNIKVSKSHICKIQNEIKNHHKFVDILVNDFKKKGYRAINLRDCIPDLLVRRGNKIYAIETSKSSYFPEFKQKKYNMIKFFFDKILYFKRTNQ